MSDYRVKNYRNQPQMDDMNAVFEKIQSVIDGGVAGGDGDKGDNGWTPELAVEADESRRVLRVVGWLGGEGDMPSTGLYVAQNGYTDNIANAVDIRGEQGSQGIDGDSGTDGADGIDGEDGVQGEDGVGLVFNWDGTQLGVAKADDFYVDFDNNTVYNYEYVDLKGGAGVGLVYDWNGTQLGVAREDDFVLDFDFNPSYNYEYTDLKGDDGVGIPAGGATGEVLQKLSEDDYDTGWATPSGGGSSAFTGLTDTPSDYAGNAGKVVSVSATEDALEFIDAPSGGGGAAAVEYGTWTPDIPNAGSYSQRDGIYFKIGDLVYISALIKVSGTPDVPLHINGIPFNADFTNNRHRLNPIHVSADNGISPTIPTDSVIGGTFRFPSQIAIYNGKAGFLSTGGGPINVQFYISGWYKADLT